MGCVPTVPGIGKGSGQRRISGLLGENKSAQNQAGQGQSSQKVIANEKRGFKGHDNY